MNLASLLLTSLYALAAVAFIGVLNARGVWRVSVASVLMLGCLGAALWHTTAWRATRLAAVQAAPGAGEGGTAFRGFDAGTTGAAAAGGTWGETTPDDGHLGEGSAGETSPRALILRARALRDSLGAEAPEQARTLSDSAYQVLTARAQEYVSRARDLRDALAGAADAPGGAATGALADAALAAEALSGAAGDLRGFLRAGSRDEEQRLLASFRKLLAAADAALRRAEAAGGAL